MTDFIIHLGFRRHGLSHSLAQQVVTEMTSNPLTTFVTLLTKALNTPNTPPKGRDKTNPQDIPIDGNQCR